MGAPGVNNANEKKAGGWGAVLDDHVCPECGKKVCGANTASKTARASLNDGNGRPMRRCPNTICHQAPGRNTDHLGYGKCSVHMGSTPTVRQAAAREEIRVNMRRYGVPVDIDPADALREEIHRTVGHVRWLADKVAGVGEQVEAVPDEPNVARVIEVVDGQVVDPKGDDASPMSAVAVRQPTGDEALVWGVIEREVQAGGEGGGYDRVKTGAQVNTWLQVYQAERGHLAKITDIAMKANLEGRRLDWAEAMADRLLTAFEDFATALGHDATDPQVQVATVGALQSLQALSKAA